MSMQMPDGAHRNLMMASGYPRTSFHIVCRHLFRVWYLGVVREARYCFGCDGEAKPASQVKEVQHLEGGIVAAILVREGASVEAGQPLSSRDDAKRCRSA